MTPADLQALAAKLGGAKRQADGSWMARCPCHDDGSPSLHLSVKGDRLLTRCFAACDQADVFAAVVRLVDGDRDAFPKGRGIITVADYPYQDEAGAPLFVVRRSVPKDFRPYAPDGRGGWRIGLNGARRVVYRLPELLAAPGSALHWVEGEKDADALAALGLTATTTAGGTGGLSSYGPDHLRAVAAGRSVVIWPDNDAPGEKYAAAVAAIVAPVAERVRIVRLPDAKPGGDVSDWLAAGGTRERLRELVKHAPDWTPGSTTFTVNGDAPKVFNGAQTTNDEHLNHLSGEMNTLGVLLSDVAPERIHFLSLGRFAAGKLTMADGDPGLGKSTVLMDWAARITCGQALPDGDPQPPRGVVIMSAEDGVADTIRPRAEAAGADLGRVLVLTERPDGGLHTIPDHIPEIEAAVVRMDAALLVVDPLVAYLSEGYNANRDQDVRRALAPLAAMADRTGVAVALVRHLNKMAGSNALYRGGGSIGLIGAARFGLLFARDPEDEERCIIAGTKANLSRLATSLAYRLDGTAGDVARVTWLGESALSAGRLLAGQEDPQERGALDEARAFLRDLLQEGPNPAKTVKGSARDAGVSEQTLRRAKESLDIAVTKEGFGNEGRWVWSLPKAFTPPKVSTDEHLRDPNPPKVFTEGPKVTKAFTQSEAGDVTALGDCPRGDDNAGYSFGVKKVTPDYSLPPAERSARMWGD